jgi:enoyl-CoA hydratase
MSDKAKSETLIAEDRGAVRVLRMNRPDKLNALNTALTEALLVALEAADSADGVRGLVLTGEGRAFCAGADLAEFKDLTPKNQELVLARADLTTRLQMRLQTISKPIVSAVRGAAMGGGAGLAVGCDMMVASTDLKLGYPELRHSIVPAIVMTGLQRQFGRKLAFELFSLGRMLSGEETLALGIANRLAEPDAILDVACGIAGAWGEADPRAMAASKKLFYRVADLPFAEAMAAGKEINIAMRGFREKQA